MPEDISYQKAEFEGVGKKATARLDIAHPGCAASLVRFCSDVFTLHKSVSVFVSFCERLIDLW